MAVIYLRSTDGSDASDGLTWADAKATLAAALTAAGAGGTVYVSDNHAETQAGAMALTSPGTAASPVHVICVDDSAEPPTARATTATVTVSGTVTMTFEGFAYYYGISFVMSANSASADISMGISASAWWHYFDSCALKLTGGASGQGFILGSNNTASDDQGVVFHNTVFQFSHASQTMLLRGPVLWQYTPSAFSGTVPTAIFLTSAGSAVELEINGVDLSALGSSNLINFAPAATGAVRLANCKLGSGFVLGTGTFPGQGGFTVEAVNCDSADTNYRYAKHTYAGTITTVTAADNPTGVRTGGASDGTTAIGYKFVTTANSKHYAPLYGPWVTFWNETLGTVTLTAHVVTDNVTLTDAEAWIEVEYLGTSGAPLSLLAKDQIADPIFGTPVSQTASSETFTTTGLTTPVIQQLHKDVTPAEKGPIRARVVLAKPSTTMYADFKFAA